MLLNLVTHDEMSKLTIEELKNEIVERQNLIQTMVGTLYPSIVGDEILKITDFIRNRQNNA